MEAAAAAAEEMASKEEAATNAKGDEVPEKKEAVEAPKEASKETDAIAAADQE